MSFSMPIWARRLPFVFPVVVALAGAAAQPVPVPPAPNADAPAEAAIDRVMSLTLGGPRRQEEFYLPLAEGDSVIVDLIPVNPLAVAPPSPLVGSATSIPRPAAGAASPVSLAIVGPTGEILKRVTANDPRAASRRTLTLETAVGDFGARIALYAQAAGRYRILAGYSGSSPAGFELLVRHRTLPAPPKSVTLRMGVKQGGELQAGERMLFRLPGLKAGTQISVLMTSETLDSNLELHGPGGETSPLIRGDDDSGGGNDAQILTTIPADGDYTVVARSTFSRAGNFHILAEPYDPPRLVPIALTPGKARSGEFNGKGQGIYIGEDTLMGYHLYSLEGEANEKYSISMASDDADLDPMLQAGIPATVTNEESPTADDLAVIAENDDDEGWNAKLHIRFRKKGRILIRAGAADEAHPRGKYRILVVSEGR